MPQPESGDPDPEASLRLVEDAGKGERSARGMTAVIRRPEEPGEREAAREERLPPDLFGDTLENAELLLLYAAEIGVEIDDLTRNSILSAMATRSTGWTRTIAANLLVAETKLAAKLKPVTVASLKAHAGEAKHTVRIYLYVAILLAIIIVPASMVTSVTSTISSSITKDINSANDLAVRLGTSFDSPAAQASGRPAGVLFVDIVRDLQTFTATMRAIHTRARQLNWFIRNSEYDPLRQFRPVKGEPPQETQRKIEEARKLIQLPVRLPSNLRDVWPRLIGSYQQERAFGQSVVDDVYVFYGAMTSCLLPVLYALLGTCAYLLRSFQQNMANRTFIPSHANSPRFLIAAIGGAVVGLFNSLVVSQSITIPPLAIAFLVGYAVDVFFSFLEGVIRAFTRDKSGAGASATTPSTSATA